MVGGHAEVLLGVFAEETEAREIQQRADLLDASVGLTQQPFNLLHAHLVDNRLRRFAGYGMTCHRQIFGTYR